MLFDVRSCRGRRRGQTEGVCPHSYYTESEIKNKHANRVPKSPRRSSFWVSETAARPSPMHSKKASKVLLLSVICFGRFFLNTPDSRNVPKVEDPLGAKGCADDCHRKLGSGLRVERKNSVTSLWMDQNPASLYSICCGSERLLIFGGMEIDLCTSIKNMCAMVKVCYIFIGLMIIPPFIETPFVNYSLCAMVV